jgi:hypothetical protein
MLRIGLFAFALLLTACANASADAPASGRDCFRNASVTGFEVVDRSTIQVRVGASRRYVLTTNWQTSNMNFAEHMALRSTTGQVCTGNGLGIEIVGGDPLRSYPIDSIVRAPDPAPAPQN